VPEFRIDERLSVFARPLAGKAALLSCTEQLALEQDVRILYEPTDFLTEVSIYKYCYRKQIR
jgi:hypothetical protein